LPGKPVVKAIQAAARHGARIAGLGSGVFVLGAAGVLDGRTVTTHWRYADELGARHPSALVDRDRLVVVDGPVITGAGGGAALDLCLELLRIDLGDDAAVAAARHLALPPGRLGGQSVLFSDSLIQPRSQELSDACSWALRHLAEGIDVADVTARVGCSPRTLQRWFLDELGVSPRTWLIARRVERARRLLETSDQPIDEIAAAVGIRSVSAFRAQFHRRLGVSPSTYRTAYQGAGRSAVGPPPD